MFLCFACRVQRMLSIEATFEGITRVFKKLSSILAKTSCYVGEMHENLRFFEIKGLFLKKTHMFLFFACRVQRMISIDTSFGGLEVTRIVHGIRVRFGSETAEEESLAALVGLL